MRKVIFFICVLALAGCENTEYESYLKTMDMENVSKLTLNPNSPVLIADGNSELKFIVKAYMDVEHKRTIELKIDGKNVLKDSVFKTTTLVKADRLLGEEMIITSSRGETVDNFTYSTDTGAGTEVEFTCTLAGRTSAPCKVRLIPRPAPYTKEIVVPVVFHILSETSTIEASKAITGNKAKQHLDRANKALAGQLYPTAPAWVDSKIRLVMATHDPDGKLLAEPGIDRHNFGANFNDYYSKPIDYCWNPDKYLNIYVYSSWYSTAVGPQSIFAGKELKGFPNLVKIDDPTKPYYGAADSDWGILIFIDHFLDIAKPGNSTRFESLVGLFYGLMDTYYKSWKDDYKNTGDVDYCSDTYTYRSVNMSIEKQTYVPDTDNSEPIYYNSYNVMDGSTNSTVFTPEQVARMRFVIENCPGRRAGW